MDSTLSDVALRQGRVAVLGVVKFEEPDQIRPTLISVLERTFHEERRDIPLLTSGSVRRMLGTERYRSFMLEYEFQGRLARESLKEIADSLRGAAKFLLLARVEKDRPRARSILAPDTTRGCSAMDTGIPARDARVAVQLYDLGRQDLVASFVCESSTKKKKSSSLPLLTPPSTRSALEIGVKEWPEGTGYPGAPELARALEEPFRTFARTLPGPQPPAQPAEPKKTPPPAAAPQPSSSKPSSLPQPILP